ncbi:AAA family ATPase [Streptomyces sp. NPDC088733]|uniref:AAA family ATPase n=1 Tax=Streptomyces sp. NPDC088733 TaxID=3365880 RepID=UPI00380B3B6C
MTVGPGSAILPYSYIVGQHELKLALELNHIAPGIGGVLISGQRGTAKSTVVRAFSAMVHGELPVTLPINATDDRVLGGWDLDALMRGEAVVQRGLLDEAGDKGLLYVDEVNLLDDHVVDIILDAASTGWLTVQREALNQRQYIRFGIVGTMNPEEGGLRPQLLDRFGLMATASELAPEQRREVISTVLRFDEARDAASSPWLDEGREQDAERSRALHAAKEAYERVELSTSMIELCADVASLVRAVGHRGELVTAFAARAMAALEGAPHVRPDHVRAVAPLALRHRRPDAAHGGPVEWTAEGTEGLDGLFA